MEEKKTVEDFASDAIKLWIKFDIATINAEQYEQGLINLFEQAQKDAYNQALEDAVAHGEVKRVQKTCRGHGQKAGGGSWLEHVIDRESILKLKKK